MRKQLPVVIAAIVLAACTIIFVGVPLAAADQQTSDPSASASVVRVDRVVPARHKLVKRHFQPWSKPSPGQVREIIRAEARRWHIAPSGLARRVGCESHFHWWAGNGQFQGVLQFSPGTFYRGLRTIRDRRVRLVRQHVRMVHEARVVHYSDGRVTRKRGRRRNQTVTYVLKGRLPRKPSMANAWAQIRIGAQAIRGISAVHNSEWSCAA
jgi:hypothetical protein